MFTIEAYETIVHDSLITAHFVDLSCLRYYDMVSEPKYADILPFLHESVTQSTPKFESWRAGTE